jgi:GT2 family glycosyltransferase
MITCSIVLYNNDEAVLSETINSFLNTKLDIFLFLVDNSPIDLLNKFANHCKIKYIHNPANPGFGASHNIAIKESFLLKSDYHLVLNPDIYFEKGTLEKIVSFMEIRPEIGHLMPKILFPDNKMQYLCKTNPTVFDLFARGFMPRFLKEFFKKRLDKYEYRSNNLNDIIYDIPYLSGCFMFFRTNTLKQVGFFDEKIFMYLEDADITRRFLNISRTVYYPSATVYHHYAGLTHKLWKYKWITIKSAITYFNKWGWLNSII